MQGVYDRLFLCQLRASFSFSEVDGNALSRSEVKCNNFECKHDADDQLRHVVLLTRKAANSQFAKLLLFPTLVKHSTVILIWL